MDIQPAGKRMLMDAELGKFEEVPFYHRSSLNPGAAIDGPAVIIENDTSTVVSKRFRARIVRSDCIVMEAKQTV